MAYRSHPLGVLKAPWRLLRTVLHVLHGMAVVAWVFPRMDEPGRHARIAHWSGGLLRCLGLTLQVSGRARPGATLLVANHVSWLDIAALHAVVPQARFVSKADVKHWPLVGKMVAGAGTLFIERTSKRDALRVVHAMADALAGGQTVAVFPEGTTGPGPELLNFHANLLQAAIATGTPVQPAVLRYRDPQHRFSPAAEFVGDTTLLQSIWATLRATGLQAVVHYGEPQRAEGRDRRTWAQDLRDAVTALRED